MINEPDCREKLDRIFGGANKELQRKELDDKSSRNPQLWEDLAVTFNSSEYAPENDIDDDRLSEIDPSKPPSTKWTGSELRTTFSKLRSVMTIKTRNFKASGQHVQGDDNLDGDDELADSFNLSDEDHAKCNKDWEWNGCIYLFIYILYGRSAPHFVTRDQVPAMCLDEGVSGDKVLGGGVSGKKRNYSDTNQQDKLIAALNAPIVISKDKTEMSLLSAQLAHCREQSKVAQATVVAADMLKCENKMRMLRDWISKSDDSKEKAEWLDLFKQEQEKYLKF